MEEGTIDQASEFSLFTQKPLCNVCFHANLRMLIFIFFLVHIFIKSSFHMSEKSQTIGDFTLSRQSHILPRYREFIGDRCRFYLSGWGGGGGGRSGGVGDL